MNDGLKVLRAMWPEPIDGQFLCTFRKDNNRSKWFKLDELESLWKTGRRWSEIKAVNAYWGLCCGVQPDVEPQKLKYKRVTKALSRYAPGYYLDLDVDGHLDNEGKKVEGLPHYKEVIEKLETLSEPPTLVINSGGGIYPIWLFNEPLWIGDEDALSAFENGNKSWHYRIQDLCGGVDNTHDSARILRLPGWVNAKYGTEVSLVSFDDSRRYDPANQLIGPKIDVAKKTAKKDRGGNLIKNGAGSATERLIRRDKIRSGERNDELLRQACAILRSMAELTNGAALTAEDDALWSSFQDLNDARCEPPVSLGELYKIWKSAKSFIQREFVHKKKQQLRDMPTGGSHLVQAEEAQGAIDSVQRHKASEEEIQKLDKELEQVRIAQSMDERLDELGISLIDQRYIAPDWTLSVWKGSYPVLCVLKTPFTGREVLTIEQSELADAEFVSTVILNTTEGRVCPEFGPGGWNWREVWNGSGRGRKRINGLRQQLSGRMEFVSAPEEASRDLDILTCLKYWIPSQERTDKRIDPLHAEVHYFDDSNTWAFKLAAFHEFLERDGHKISKVDLGRILKRYQCDYKQIRLAGKVVRRYTVNTVVMNHLEVAISTGELS